MAFLEIFYKKDPPAPKPHPSPCAPAANRGRLPTRALLEAAVRMPTRSKVAKLVARPRRSGDSAHVAYGKQVIEAERAGLEGVAQRLGPNFSRAVDWVLSCTGRVVVSGMGKSGFIAQKLSATFASTGTPSALSASHRSAAWRSLGRVVSGDLVVALSNSGATDELLRLLPAVRDHRRAGSSPSPGTSSRRSRCGLTWCSISGPSTKPVPWVWLRPHPAWTCWVWATLWR